MMLVRYFELREFISADDEELAEEMPSPTANWCLKTLFIKLVDLELITRKHQSEGHKMLDAHES